MRAWAVRRALRHGRTVPPGTRSARAVVPDRRVGRTSFECRRSDLAAAATLAKQRGTARELASRARRSQPGSDAPRAGRAPRSLYRAPAAVVGDRGPALG